VAPGEGIGKMNSNRSREKELRELRRKPSEGEKKAEDS